MNECLFIHKKTLNFLNFVKKNIKITKYTKKI